MIESTIIEGLSYSLMALGVFITFRILDFPDLTVEGSFPLGAALAVQSLVSGYDIGFVFVIAFLGGVLAGVLTAMIHNRLKVPNLLAGILTMTMLYSINIRILGDRANLPILKHETICSQITGLADGVLPEEYALLFFFLIFTFIVKTLLDMFFRTDMGLILRAMGNNEQMIVSQGINPKLLKTIGLGISNGLIALSGAFIAQYNGFADVGMGQGIIVIGLASVMLGEFIVFKSRKMGFITLSVILGSVAFKAIMYLGRYYGDTINMTPGDLKLITSAMIVLSLVLTKSGKQGIQ